MDDNKVLFFTSTDTIEKEEEKIRQKNIYPKKNLALLRHSTGKLELFQMWHLRDILVKK